MNFHEKLAALKGEMSIAALARRIGAEYHLVEDWLKKTLPDISEALLISKSFGVPLEYLADDKMQEIPASPEPPKRSIWRAGIEEKIEKLGEEAVLARILSETSATNSDIPPAMGSRLPPGSPPGLPPRRTNRRNRDDRKGE